MTPAELAEGLDELRDELASRYLGELFGDVLGEAAAVLREVADDSRATVADATSLADALDALAGAHLQVIDASLGNASNDELAELGIARTAAMQAVVDLWTRHTMSVGADDGT